MPLLKQAIKANFAFEHKELEREVFGLKFKNPIGLAAGFDKDAKLIDGSVTPAGEGDGEVRELLLALKKKGFEGFLSLEPHLKVAEALGGFSGAELFKKASLALKTILSEVGSGKWEVNFKF